MEKSHGLVTKADVMADGNAAPSGRDNLFVMYPPRADRSPFPGACQRRDGRWDIPGDLLGQLAAREQSHPQHRLRVERTDEPDRGPTQRSTPNKTAERDALGQTLAKDLRLAYVSDPPAFRGFLLDCEPTRSGEKFSRVLDYRRGQFTLIPTPPDAERFQGRTVTVSRDQGHRLVIQRGPEISR